MGKLLHIKRSAVAPSELRHFLVILEPCSLHTRSPSGDGGLCTYISNRYKPEFHVTTFSTAAKLQQDFEYLLDYHS